MQDKVIIEYTHWMWVRNKSCFEIQADSEYDAGKWRGRYFFFSFLRKKKEYEAGWLGVWNGLEGLKGEKNMIKMNCMKNKF